MQLLSTRPAQPTHFDCYERWTFFVIFSGPVHSGGLGTVGVRRNVDFPDEVQMCVCIVGSTNRSPGTRLPKVRALHCVHLSSPGVFFFSGHLVR